MSAHGENTLDRQTFRYLGCTDVFKHNALVSYSGNFVYFLSSNYKIICFDLHMCLW